MLLAFARRHDFVVGIFPVGMHSLLVFPCWHALFVGYCLLELWHSTNLRVGAICFGSQKHFWKWWFGELTKDQMASTFLQHSQVWLPKNAPTLPTKMELLAFRKSLALRKSRLASRESLLANIVGSLSHFGKWPFAQQPNGINTESANRQRGKYKIGQQPRRNSQQHQTNQQALKTHTPE